MERDIQRKVGFSLKLHYNLPNSSEWVIYESFTSTEVMICQLFSFLQYAYVLPNNFSLLQVYNNCTE